MVTSGNTFHPATNSMTIGDIDECSTSGSGNNAQHNHPAHLIIQDVEDLVGWQARLNYDGGQMRPSMVNFTPFVDNNTGQNVSFLNLPLDGGVHRSLITASNIPPQSAEAQTALVGAAYNGAQTFAVSPDTPAKSPPDDGSYSAPGGGVLASVSLQVLAGQLGQPSLYVDLDDGSPNAPGSSVVVFTGSGTATVSLAESELGDGFHGEGTTCVPLGPLGLDDAGGGAGVTGGEEPVGAESHEAADHCPEDLNADTYVDISDVSLLTGWFGSQSPPAPAEYDLSGDGYIDISDVSQITGYFGGQCFGGFWESQMDGNDSVSGPNALGVWNCYHRGVAWYKSKTATHALIGGFGDGTWWGETECEGGIGLYSTQCFLGVWSHDGTNWQLRGVTGTAEYSGLKCGANGTDPGGQNAVQIPLGEPFKYGLQHAIYEDGYPIHPSEFHFNEDVWPPFY